MREEEAINSYKKLRSERELREKVSFVLLYYYYPSAVTDYVFSIFDTAAGGTCELEAAARTRSAKGCQFVFVLSGIYRYFIVITYLLI